MNVDAKVLLDEAALMALQIRFLEKRIAELESQLASENPQPVQSQ